VSDGERRRVQLCMGLMVPWDVLLLDEVSALFSSGVTMCSRTVFRSQSIWVSPNWERGDDR
jgi:alpha-D-ribose 1-methylphosphonate 5-triphosphate synthase subunit PhnL